jgi:hypothetical protein
MFGGGHTMADSLRPEQRLNMFFAQGWLVNCRSGVAQVEKQRPRAEQVVVYKAGSLARFGGLLNQALAGALVIMRSRNLGFEAPMHSEISAQTTISNCASAPFAHPPNSKTCGRSIARLTAKPPSPTRNFRTGGRAFRRACGLSFFETA